MGVTNQAADDEIATERSDRRGSVTAMIPPATGRAGEVLAAMRQAGTPAGVLMFRAAGTEPTLSVHDVVETIEASPT
jgi:hypothetical protein